MNVQQKITAPVAIVGGGIAGCATAYFLAKRGIHALLLEKSTFGFEASGRNAGGVRAQCRDISAERILAMHSIDIWEGLAAELETDLEYVQGGTLRLAATPERLADLQVQAKEELADGLAVELWDPDQLYAHVPHLAPGFLGAKYCARDGVANPKLVAPALAAAAQRLGATTWEGTEVTRIHVDEGQVTGLVATNAEGEWQIETPLVIHTGGPWTPEISATVGIDLPITPSRTIIAKTEPLPPMFTEFISSHDTEVYARPDREGRIHIGAVAQPMGSFDECTAADIHAYVERRANLIPALGEAKIDEVWWGTLAMTPDRQPIIGPVAGVAGYLIAAGFSGHGFCLGPIVGKLMAEWVIDGAPSLDISAFALDRFQRERSTAHEPRMIAG